MKNFRVRSIRKLISSSPTVSFTRGSCSELGTSSPREPLASSFTSVPLFLSYERLSSLFFFLCFSLGQSVFQCSHPNGDLPLFQLLTFREFNATAKKVVLHFASSFFCCCSLLNTLFFFLINLFYFILFIFGCVRSLLLCAGFL